MQQIMTLEQVARYIVACYPSAPDMLSVMTCAAREAGEPPMEELLLVGRPITRGLANVGNAAAEHAGSEWRRALAQPLRVLHARR
jgi:hypothetical protein